MEVKPLSDSTISPGATTLAVSREASRPFWAQTFSANTSPALLYLVSGASFPELWFLTCIHCLRG